MSGTRKLAAFGCAFVLLAVVLVPTAAVGSARSQSSVSSQSSVTVHVIVETNAGATGNVDPSTASALPGTAACDVDVPKDSDGGVVFDTAVADGCILEWDYYSFDCCGRFVTSIDGLRGDAGTCLADPPEVSTCGFHCVLYNFGVCQAWYFYQNGQLSNEGIDDYTADDGDTLRWVHRNTPP